MSASIHLHVLDLQFAYISNVNAVIYIYLCYLYMEGCMLWVFIYQANALSCRLLKCSSFLECQWLKCCDTMWYRGVSETCHVHEYIHIFCIPLDFTDAIVRTPRNKSEMSTLCKRSRSQWSVHRNHITNIGIKELHHSSRTNKSLTTHRRSYDQSQQTSSRRTELTKIAEARG